MCFSGSVMHLGERVDFSFPGFSSQPASCLLTIHKNSAHRGLVVGCIQKRNYVGTSITNAFESILTAFHERALAGKLGAEVESAYRDVCAVAEAKVLEGRSLLRKILDFFLRRSIEISPVQLIESGLILWLEIYPKGTGILESRTTIQRVRIGSDGHPVWSSALDPNGIEKLTGIGAFEISGEND